MLKIAICDDDLNCLSQTQRIIEQVLHDTHTVADVFCFDNGDSLIDKNENCKLDIIFLDIIMPLLNGMDTARQIRLSNNAANIIFLTSSPEFALESYSVKASDYLLKPVSYEKVESTIKNYMKTLDSEPDSIIIKTSYGYQKIYLHEIEYIETQNRHCVFNLISGKTLETPEPMYTFESVLLMKPGVFKCHRSYIVFMSNVDHFNLSEITTKCGHHIPIARGLGKAFNEAYFSFMFSE